MQKLFDAFAAWEKDNLKPKTLTGRRSFPNRLEELLRERRVGTAIRRSGRSTDLAASGISDERAW